MSLRTRGPSHPTSPQPQGHGPYRPLPPAGWFPDPTGRARLRHWSGQAWTQWVFDDGAVRRDAEPHRHLDTSDIPHLDFVEHVFLPDARALGCVTPDEEALLEHLLRTLRADASAHPRQPGPASLPVAPRAGLTPTAPTLPRPPATRSVTAPAPVPTPTAPALRTPPTPPPRSALARWWGRTREAVGSDLAVHGLAYLGVLLFFVGAFGLVVFAFGDVSPSLRPVAELVIALTPFAAAAVLLRRDAVIVGRALELMGGLLVPVMLVTGFLDDVAVPPDLYGVTLAATLTVLTSLVAVAYAGWSARHPHSALRFLVAPVAWLAVGMATLGLGERDIPDGKGVATPSAAQTAAMTAALVVTVLLARWRPDHRLSSPTRTAALPGLAVIASLSVLTWVAEGWPVAPVVASGALALVALELLSDRLPATGVGIVEPLWWALVATGLAQGAGAAPVETAVVGAVTALGFLAVVEAAGLAHRSALALALPALGVLPALALTWVEPWWAVASFGVATAWAAARRTAPFAVRGAPVVLDAATAVLPALALLALGRAASAPVAIVTGGVLVLAATVPARWPYLRRGPTDRYWTWWWAVAGTASLLAAVGTLGRLPEWTWLEQWMLVATLALLTEAGALGPVRPRWRPPVVTLGATLTWLAAASVLEATSVVAVTPLAVLGLAMVVLAHVPRVAAREDAASVGLTGHVLGLATIVVLAGEPGWAPVVAVALATAGWATTAWLDLRGASPVGARLARVDPTARSLPLVLAGAGVPAAVSLLLDRADTLPLADPWSVAVPAATAVAYAAITRLRVADRLAAVLAWEGFALAVTAAVWEAVLFGALTAGFWDPRTTAALGLAALPATVLLVRPSRRAPVMTWTAWAALAPLAGLVAAEVSSRFAALTGATAASVTLVAVGSVLLVGAAATDLRGRAWTPHLLPEHGWALPPAVVGAAEAALGVAVAVTTLEPDVAGWVLATAAAAVLATAVLSRVGARVGVAVVLGWAAALALAGEPIDAQPWIAVAVSALALGAAQALSPASAGVPWWARWDVPLLVSAAPVAGTALVLTAGEAPAAAVSTVVGAECLVVAARLWRHTATALAVGVTGTLLVLVGAGTAGTGWLALAVLGLSVALTTLAVRTRGTVRLALQVAGALAAVVAAGLACDALGLSAQGTVEAGAIGAALVAVAAAVVAVTTSTRPGIRSWLLVWGGAAVVVGGFCGLAVLVEAGSATPTASPSWPVAAGLAGVAAALATAAAPLAIRWLRDVAAGYGLVALAVGLLAADVTLTVQVVVPALVSVTSAALTLAVSRRPAEHAWRRPLLEVAAATTLWALAAALTASETVLVVPVLAAAAVQAAALGTVLHRPALQAASPVLACAAWLVFSAEALDGNPQWVTVPIGLATLVVVALWRRARAERGQPVGSPEIVALELVGVAFLVGSSFVQAFTDSVAYAVLAAVIGLGVAAWGVVSRVRRRVAAGVGVVLGGVVVLIGLPLWDLLVPSWDTASSWILIAVAGLVALAVAALLDRGRALAHRERTRIEEATAGWE